jgi:hypothetical protein
MKAPNARVEGQRSGMDANFGVMDAAFTTKPVAMAVAARECGKILKNSRR